jgi:hypothetical protein
MFRRFLNLVYFPPYTIHTVFKIISTQIKSTIKNESILKFIDYFKNTYIGTRNSELNSIVGAMYNVNNWSAYERILRRQPRTTNAVESWHRTLNRRCDIAPPNIATFINTLQIEEELVRIQLIKRKGGNFKFDKNRLDYEEKLRICVENYDLYTIEEYFEILDHLTKWKLE